MVKKKLPTSLTRMMKYGVDEGSIEEINHLSNDVPVPIKAQDVVGFFLNARSNEEKEWNQFGKQLVEAETGNKALFAGYEWLSFKLPGGSYTPDWAYFMSDGSWVFVEIKASKFQKGYRDARSKLRAAATLNPWFVFYEAMRDRGFFALEKIERDEGYTNNLKSVLSVQLQKDVEKVLNEK